MKKGERIVAEIEEFKLPATGIGRTEDGERVLIKSALPGQQVEATVTKKRKNKIEARLEDVVRPREDQIPAACSVDSRCGGCLFQTLPYNEEIKIKEDYILGLLGGAVGESEPEAIKETLHYEGILPSPESSGYRNKMEYTFGDDRRDGPLHLGMHERGKFYNVVNTDGCLLTDPDFDQIRRAVVDYFAGKDQTYYHKKTHEGMLRHLVVRKGKKSGEILVNLVTTSEDGLDEDEFVDMIKALPLSGKIVGIIQTINDSPADAVIPESVKVLDGEPILHDSILGLDFEISPFSFFQVNTLGAEKLYSVVRDFDGEGERDVIYDLYCGTGTITQLLAERAGEVIGIELVEEAVEAAKKNAEHNKIDNTRFIAGDVLKEAHRLDGTADLIVLDPPRDGIHPKAMRQILDLNPQSYIYVSCKPESLARDLPFFLNRGYQIRRTKIVDMFPRTGHVETVVLLEKEN